MRITQNAPVVVGCLPARLPVHALAFPFTRSPSRSRARLPVHALACPFTRSPSRSPARFPVHPLACRSPARLPVHPLKFHPLNPHRALSTGAGPSTTAAWRTASARACTASSSPSSRTSRSARAASSASASGLYGPCPRPSSTPGRRPWRRRPTFTPNSTKYIRSGERFAHNVHAQQPVQSFTMNFSMLQKSLSPSPMLPRPSHVVKAAQTSFSLRRRESGLNGSVGHSDVMDRTMRCGPRTNFRSRMTTSIASAPASAARSRSASGVSVQCR